MKTFTIKPLKWNETSYEDGSRTLTAVTIFGNYGIDCGPEEANCTWGLNDFSLSKVKHTSSVSEAKVAATDDYLMRVLPCLEEVALGWNEDMSQAPRDGQQVLLRDKSHGILLAYYGGDAYAGAYQSGSYQSLKEGRWYSGMILVLEPEAFMEIPYE